MKHSPSNSAPTNRLVSQSQATSQQLQSPTKSQSQSRSQSPQQAQQSQPLYPWSTHTPPPGQWPSPFPRHFPGLSTSATAAGELFLFGGYVNRSSSPNLAPSNDLYVISTRNFSATLLQTSGDVPDPRYGHSAVLTGTTLLVWGGRTDFSDQEAQNRRNDDSLYLLNLVSREWTRIEVGGPGPCGRYYHTMTLVGSKLFVFGGKTAKTRLNDIWALDLNYLKSNPFWESYDPAPGNEKPLPRAGHVSVTTDDRIVIFGGAGGPHIFEDTWSFNISTRKWTELPYTESILPRVGHAAALIDDVMYVFGGCTVGGAYVDDLTAFNLSTQRWTTFQDIGPSPCGRRSHAMASDGRRIFVIGGNLSQGALVDETKLIQVLDTKLLIYPKPESNTVKYSERTTQLAQKLSVGHPTQGQPQHRTFYSSDAGAVHGDFPFQKATSEEMGCPASPQITRERNSNLNGLPSRPMDARGKPRRVPEEVDDGEGSMEHHAPSGKEIARLDNVHLIELERQLSETLVAKAERERRIAQLIDELALKSALLEQVEAKLALKNALLEQAEANAAEEKRRAGLELRELQAMLDEVLRSRDHEFEASKSESAAFRLRLADTGNGRSKGKAKLHTYSTQIATGSGNTDEDRVVHRLMERVQSMEAEIASLRGNEKSFEMMECSNEG